MSKIWKGLNAGFTSISAVERFTSPKRFLVAISAANLNLIWQWRVTIYAAPADRFYLVWPVSRWDYMALLALLAALTSLLYLLLTAAYRTRPRWRIGALLLVFSLFSFAPAHYLLQVVDITLSFERTLFLLVTLAAAVLLFLLPRLMYRTVFWFFLLLAPYAPVTIGNVALALAQPQAAPVIPAMPRASWPVHQRRVVVMLFDELDQRILSDQLNGLPAFRRLLAKSTMATGTIPAGGSTINAIPSLLTGERMAQSIPTGVSDLILQRASGELIHFDGAGTFIAALHRQGARIAVSGWQLPYCRLLAGFTETCHEKLGAALTTKASANFPEALVAWGRTLQPLQRRRLAHRMYEETLSDTRALGCGPFDLVYIHVPVPHYPVLWSRHSTSLPALAGEIWRSALSSDPGYAENLRAADEVLEALLRGLESCGRSQTTHIVVSGDHGLRSSYLQYPGTFSRRGPKGNPGDVPFIVHLAGQRQANIVATPVDAIALGDLVQAMWAGTVASPADMAPIWNAR